MWYKGGGGLDGCGTNGGGLDGRCTKRVGGGGTIVSRVGVRVGVRGRQHWTGLQHRGFTIKVQLGRKGLT